MIRTSTSGGRLRHMFDLSGTLKSFLVWPLWLLLGPLKFLIFLVSSFFSAFSANEVSNLPVPVDM